MSTYKDDLLLLMAKLLVTSNDKMKPMVKNCEGLDAAIIDYQIDVNEKAIKEVYNDDSIHDTDTPIVYEYAVKLLQELHDTFADDPTGLDVKRKAITQHLIDLLNP